MKKKQLLMIGIGLSFILGTSSAPMTAEIDLFKPFIKLKKETPVSKTALLPIQRLQLSEISLKGIIWNPKRPLALVEDPAGKGYIIKVGDPIGPSGHVKEIRRDKVIIEEKYMDVFEGEKTRLVELALPKKEALLP